MIEYRKGNIWESGADTIVVPVNCNGVMGAGLAKQCKERYPEVYAAYKSDCDRSLMEKGRGRLYPTGGKSPSVIHCVATKLNWRYHSRLEWVKSCIIDVRFEALGKPSEVVAVPALGCGLGGLNWNDVKAYMEEWFGKWSPDVKFLVYEPEEL